MVPTNFRCMTFYNGATDGANIAQTGLTTKRFMGLCTDRE
jgi:hypothetical protein